MKTNPEDPENSPFETQPPGIGALREVKYDDAVHGDTVASWWTANTGGVVKYRLFPPWGIVMERNGEPLGACWIKLWPDTGVAELEDIVMRPRLSIEEGDEVMRACLYAFESLCRRSGYRLLLGYMHKPTALWLEKSCGFHSFGERVAVFKEIE